MKKLRALLEKKRIAYPLLFVCSFVIYFLYFHFIFFNLNSILSSITNDSLKNYYTYVYHIKNDNSLLQFNGMNYPYGEHVIYTDCQPLLTFVLKLLPFTHQHLIGIMHGLIFLSFIISPLILYRILRVMEIDGICSFFVSLAISFMSPQFVKINAGHFALAYGCLIPISILYTLNCINSNQVKHALRLFIFNTLLFLLHPYLGFCLSLFSFFGLLFAYLFAFEKKDFGKKILTVFSTGLLPLLLFKFFMLLSDHHSDRPTEPYGAENMVENIDSIVSPTFGPFQTLMEHFFSDRPGHYEGHTYLGFFVVVTTMLFLVSLLIFFRKFVFKKELVALVISAFLFLLISFGVHLKVMALFHFESATINQFRAVCRFAWIFYFVWPIFLVAVFYHSTKGSFPISTFASTSLIFSLLFLALNLIESKGFFTKDQSMFWKYRNFFNEQQLNEEEKKVLSSLHSSQPQSILPLPMFHGGSEMFDRPGSNNSMIPSMIYSYHSGIPISSVLMSRTSITETENLIELLNSYKQTRAINSQLTAKDFFVIVTKDPLLPDETRLLKEVTSFEQNDSLKFAYLSVKKLLEPKISEPVLQISERRIEFPDCTSVLFIPFEKRKPFERANILDYETIYSLDSNRIVSGDYIVSFHYHFEQNNYKAVAANFIVNKANATESEWIYNIPVRIMSGFYKGFGVFEYKIRLEKNCKYDFMLKGFVDHSYAISDFMLRPESLNIITKQGQANSFNNFPN